MTRNDPWSRIAQCRRKGTTMIAIIFCYAAVVAVVGGCGGGVLFCLAKDIARVGVCRCVCVVLKESSPL